jgi:hypothetical protein
MKILNSIGFGQAPPYIAGHDLQRDRIELDCQTLLDRFDNTPNDLDPAEGILKFTRSAGTIPQEFAGLQRAEIVKKGSEFKSADIYKVMDDADDFTWIKEATQPGFLGLFPDKKTQQFARAYRTNEDYCQFGSLYVNGRYHGDSKRSVDIFPG